MSDEARPLRKIRSRSPWFWAYLAGSFVLLLLLMFLVADRMTETSSSFEPIASSETVEPVNEFVPADRSISECISAIPKPGCGSEARGGWHQWLVLLAIVLGLAVIAWRVVASARKAKAAASAAP